MWHASTSFQQCTLGKLSNDVAASVVRAINWRSSFSLLILLVVSVVMPLLLAKSSNFDGTTDLAVVTLCSLGAIFGSVVLGPSCCSP